jgi:DNA-binding SARP family transcriptional activator/basic membrane lipoprotein Med (substrate-binding protein (PBP1-ABC) superfamily)
VWCSCPDARNRSQDQGKITARNEQEARLKVFLAGRIAVEAEGVVIDERHFPGRQGRLLFAYLVAEHGRPVPRDELAYVLWGDAPPATWDKALSVLVSKLRGVLAESGVDGASALTAAFGCYQLDLPKGTWVDVLAAESATKDAEEFLEADELESATAAAALAESVARSPFLPGDDGPWVEEKRRELAEVRARALSSLAETSLRTEKAAEAVRWAALAVEAEPFRESGYRRLMEAHVASGNRGEALRVYERCRRLLADELGAYPSPETESIYRSLLEAPSARAVPERPDATSPPGTAPPLAHRRKRPALVAAALVVLVVLVAAGTAIAVLAARADGPTASSAPRRPRVALVVPSSRPGSDDPYAQYVDAFVRAPTRYDIRARTFPIDLSKPGLSDLSGRIGKFDLVLLAGQFVAARFAREFARHPHTRFVVLDPDPVNGSLYDAVSNNPNASDVFFIEGPGAYLAGTLSALMAVQSSGDRPIAVSMIGSYPALNENVTSTFRDAARAAVPGIRVLEQESHDLVHPSVCETIANHQIDRGSRVVFADAGACSAGALSAAETRGVWGIAADQDPSHPNFGARILGYTVKNFGQEVDSSIRSYLNHTLEHGHFDIGIESRAVEFVVAPGRLVPDSIRARLERVRRQHWKKWASLAEQ